jgi:hypothetical protein
MYLISDEQIDFILNDISARGIGLEGLQLNLLDHICCIIEQELGEHSDFEQCYHAIIRRFYKDKLSEIEEETHLLLTNKNYYVMKKVMIYSGTFSAAALTMGIIFKYMHLPGTAVLITLGIGIASFVFLPLLVTLKIKEQQKAKDKLLITLGSLSAITLALAILFKIQHWPGANVMGIMSPALLALVFLPIYFFGGIRNPETKVNTIVSSVLIILGCGLFFTLTITPQGMKLMNVSYTLSYLRSEQILKNEEQQLARYAKVDTNNNNSVKLGRQVFSTCEELKSNLVEFASGSKVIDDDFESKNVFINEVNTGDYLNANDFASGKREDLIKEVNEYNMANAGHPNLKLIPVRTNIIDKNNDRGPNKASFALADLIQIQMLVLQNERECYTPGHKELVSVQ